MRYCPTTTVTHIDSIRDILRAKHGSGYVPPAPSHYFSDMAGHALEAWADQAYREGITTGCSTNPLNFCPASAVSRAEIVIFLLRAKYGAGYSPPAASHYFADMNGHWAEAFADQAYREGITSGCPTNPRNFCPTGTITRDMNAVFIENTFHLVQPPPAFSYSGTWRKYYFAGASRVAMRNCAGGGGAACSVPTFFLSDHLGSTSLGVALNGDRTSQIMYKPWGEVRYSWTASTSLPTQYTFTGQYSYMDDPTTGGATEGFGLMFYNARWYDPALGRFAQADTIVPGGVQGLDRYTYVNNNPLYYTDPDGHIALPVAVIAVAAIIFKVIDYGWTAYDTAGYLSVAANSNNTTEVRNEALGNAAMAVGMEFIEPDAPIALPLDDVVRHGDDLSEAFYKEAVQNPDSTFAVLGRWIAGDDDSYEVIGDAFGASHLNLKRFDDFTDIFKGRDEFWELINKPYIDSLGRAKKPIWLTEAYGNLDNITGGLRKEIKLLLEEYHYEFRPGSHWLLPE